MKLTDSQIQSICNQEIEAAAGYMGGDLADERATALDYYLGEPYGDEEEGRSQVVTREVYETVEWILPSLLRIFADAENIVSFEPQGPEDEQGAEQEADVCNHIFWQKNRGFYNCYVFLKDALLSKTGILKTWWDDEYTEEREEYEYLDEMGLMQLLTDESVEREVIEAEVEEDGTYSVVFKTKRKKGCVKIEPVPPEEFGVSRDARSPYAKDASFCYQRTRKTYTDLIAEGYDKKVLDGLGDDDYVDSEEEIARRNKSDEQDYSGTAPHKSRRMIWVTECYIRLDRDEDDIAELLKVTLVGSMGSGKLLDVEEVDRIPFSTSPPVILTHKFFGMSIADIVMDLQRIKSTILRQVLDNAYLANNGRTAVNDERVNLDDLLTSRPGGVVRFKGDGAPTQYLMPIPHSPLPAETFPLMEYMDGQTKARTGVGDDVAGLDNKALGDLNTGVAMLAYDAARMKIELIARIIAEIGFKPLFKDIHELTAKNQDREMVVRLRGQWVPVNPSNWREREDVTVTVGVGQVSREKKLLALGQIMEKQAMAVQAGAMGMLVTPQNLYQAQKDYVKCFGLEPSLYWQDPSQVPPAEPKGPSAEESLMQAQAQALMLDQQNKAEKTKLDAQKLMVEAQIKMREAELKAQEYALKGEIESLKAQQSAMKSNSETAGNVASIQMEMQKQAGDMRLKELELELKHVAAERDRQVEIFKAQLSAVTTEVQSVRQAQTAQESALMSAQSKAESKPEKAEKPDDGMAEMMAEFKKWREEKDTPQAIVRDERGLIAQIGKKKVLRDENGRALSIG